MTVNMRTIIWFLMCSLADGSFEGKGLTLTLAVLHDPPYVIIQDTQLSGLDIEAFVAISRHLQFNYRVVVVNDGYGELHSNGSWTGLLGVMQKKEADVCLPSLSQTPQRGQVLDISSPISSSYSRFLARRPLASIGWTHYIAPFSLTIWILLVSFLVLCSAGSAAAISINNGNRRVVHDKPDLSCSYFGRYLRWSMWICLCFISQKGVMYLPRESSGRLTLMTFAMLVVLLMGYYNSLLVAYLTVDSTKLPFDSVETLTEDPDYQVGYIRGSAYSELFEKKSVYGTGVTNLLFNKAMRRSTNLVSSNREGVWKAYNEKYVFLSWVAGIVPEIKQNYCEFAFMSGRFWLTSYGIGFQKGSPYVKPFSRVLLKLRETGSLDRLVRKYFPVMDENCEGGRSTSAPIGLIQTMFPFAFFIFGSFLSLIVFGLENLYNFIKSHGV